MKIECPSCHLAGKINEVELPLEGRHLTCPRCKNGFHVAKPAEASGNSIQMSSCPSCQYSTFTEETFAVCPKCGLTGDDYQEKVRKQRESEQLRRDQEALSRSYRNPDLVKTANEETVPEAAVAAQPVRTSAWLSLSLAGALLCYGIYGLVTYYKRDWQAVLSEPLLEPLSKVQVFFRLGFIPWLVTLFSLYFLWTAAFFLKLRQGYDRRLAGGAWAGLAVVVTYETFDFVDWMRISSSSPSFSYYATGIVSSLFMSALLGAPFLVLLWYLGTEAIAREFR